MHLRHAKPFETSFAALSLSCPSTSHLSPLPVLPEHSPPRFPFSGTLCLARVRNELAFLLRFY